MKKHTALAVRSILRFCLLTCAALLLVLLFRRIVAVNQTAVALTFLMLVLITASRWRLAYSVYAAVLCTILYNFYFLPPVGRLTIADPGNWTALVAFLCTGVLVSHLSERERQHGEDLEARRREVDLLYQFSQHLLLQEDFRGLARTAPSVAARVFGFRAVAIYVRSDDETYFSDPGNELLPVLDLKTVSTAGETAANRQGGVVIIPLSLGMRNLGALAVTESGFSQEIYDSIGSLVAITLERAAAVERSSRLEAWRQGERLRAALLDSVTHELRTPLTAIRAAATTLSSQPDLAEPERTELVAVVDEESARLDRLIGQAMEMAQLDAAALKIHASPQDVRELIETTIEEMRSQLRGRDVPIAVEEGLPQISMDRTLVHRVLRHLIENAIAYSPGGTPIGVCAGREGHRLQITVIDRGLGIDPAEQPFVFDKFFRGKKQRSHRHGTGMGLAIVRAILEAHGGGIELKSEPGNGTEFTFFIPLAPAEKTLSAEELEKG